MGCAIQKKIKRTDLSSVAFKKYTNIIKTSRVISKIKVKSALKPVLEVDSELEFSVFCQEESVLREVETA